MNKRLRVLQVMGCTSDQYASMEKYLVRKAEYFNKKGHRLYAVYEDIPKSDQFVQDYISRGGFLFNFKMNSFYDLSYYKKIYSIIKNYDIDLIHTYFSPTSHYLNIFLTIIGFNNILRTAPNLTVSSINSKNMNKFVQSYFHLRMRFLSRFVNKIICRSEGVKNEYEKAGISSDKLTVASGGVDVDFYNFSFSDRVETRKRFHIENNTLLLGIFCRLHSVKRVDRLIEFFSKIQMMNQKLKMLVAGDGPESEKLKNLTEQLNLRNSVIFVGRIENVSRLYSGLDIFCLSSISEGMSNSLLEAMSSELPIIASNIPPNKDVIDDGRGGYLITFEDEREFQEKVDMLSDFETRRRMGKYNRNKVHSKYSLNKRIEKELQIYEEVINRK